MSGIPNTQSAYIYKHGVGKLLKTEIPVPKPIGGQVLLKVKAAGMCHSDLSILKDHFQFREDGFVLGHEIAGDVAAVGESVDQNRIKIGQRFAVHTENACGSCEMCRSGHDNECIINQGRWYGFGISGGYQNYVLIENFQSLLPIPENVSYEAAAAVSDAVLTPYHAIKRSGVGAVSKVLVFGLGGLGSNALQILKAFGAYTVVVDIKPESKALADKLQADEFYTDLTKSDCEPASFDCVFDIVGLQSTFDLAQKYVKNTGSIFPIGLSQPALSFDINALAIREISIIGTSTGTSQDQIEAMKLVAAGKINPQVSTTSLETLPESLEKLERGEVVGRLVMIP